MIGRVNVECVRRHPTMESRRPGPDLAILRIKRYRRRDLSVPPVPIRSNRTIPPGAATPVAGEQGIAALDTEPGAVSKLDIGVGQEIGGSHQKCEPPAGPCRLLVPDPFFPNEWRTPISSPDRALVPTPIVRGGTISRRIRSDRLPCFPMALNEKQCVGASGRGSQQG